MTCEYFPILALDAFPCAFVDKASKHGRSGQPVTRVFAIPTTRCDAVRDDWPCTVMGALSPCNTESSKMASAFCPNNSALLTPSEMSITDHASIAMGKCGIDLMEAAGTAVANAVQRRWPRQSIVALCGLGNDGGDGFVAARHLQAAGWPVRLALLGSPSALSGSAAHHATRAWRLIH